MVDDSIKALEAVLKVPSRFIAVCRELFVVLCGAATIPGPCGVIASSAIERVAVVPVKLITGGLLFVALNKYELRLDVNVDWPGAFIESWMSSPPAFSPNWSLM